MTFAGKYCALQKDATCPARLRHVNFLALSIADEAVSHAWSSAADMPRGSDAGGNELAKKWWYGGPQRSPPWEDARISEDSTS